MSFLFSCIWIPSVMYLWAIKGVFFSAKLFIVLEILCTCTERVQLRKGDSEVTTSLYETTLRAVQDSNFLGRFLMLTRYLGHPASLLHPEEIRSIIPAQLQMVMWQGSIAHKPSLSLLARLLLLSCEDGSGPCLRVQQCLVREMKFQGSRAHQQKASESGKV